MKHVWLPLIAAVLGCTPRHAVAPVAPVSCTATAPVSSAAASVQDVDGLPGHYELFIVNTSWNEAGYRRYLRLWVPGQHKHAYSFPGLVPRIGRSLSLEGLFQDVPIAPLDSLPPEADLPRTSSRAGVVGLTIHTGSPPVHSHQARYGITWVGSGGFGGTWEANADGVIYVRNGRELGIAAGYFCARRIG